MDEPVNAVAKVLIAPDLRWFKDSINDRATGKPDASLQEATEPKGQLNRMLRVRPSHRTAPRHLLSPNPAFQTGGENDRQRHDRPFATISRMSAIYLTLPILGAAVAVGFGAKLPSNGRSTNDRSRAVSGVRR